MAKVVETLPVYAPHAARLDVPNMDPEFQYRWVSMDAVRVDFLKSIGYEVVEGENGKPRTVDNSILMRCPREQYDRRTQMRRNVVQDRLQAPRKKVLAEAEALGMEGTDSTREYRAPMSAVENEPGDKRARGEGTITREDVGLADQSGGFQNQYVNKKE